LLNILCEDEFDIILEETPDIYQLLMLNKKQNEKN
jgi:hypothetical protein